MKPKGVDDEIKDYSLKFSPGKSACKLPIDIEDGLKPLDDFMEIPCDRIVEYQRKQGSDFLPWPKEKFELLVSSVKAAGVIEPVTVRPLASSDGMFEMLAGEHRWKASIEAERKSVPAHVMRECSDEMAAHVFSVTNVLRRDNSIRDRINGWWHYFQLTSHKREADIQQLISANIITQEMREKARTEERNIRRYIKMHDLIDELIDLMDQKRLGAVAGEQYAYLSKEQQVALLDYKHNLNSAEKAKALRSLAEGGSWSKEEIEKIIFPNEKSTVMTLTAVSNRVKTIIRDTLPQSAYNEAEEIIRKALAEYMERHPDLVSPQSKQTK